MDFALIAAEKNRSEIEKVLYHYKDDSLKYSAACFLISNMPYHSFYDGTSLEQYYKYYKCINGRGNEIQVIIDSLKQTDGEFHLNSLRKKLDIQELDSAYIVENIDWAFKVWREQPWGKNVCFLDFCEYILPYKIEDEVPVHWREEFYNKYNAMLDSVRNLPQSQDPAFVAKVLFDSLTKFSITYTGLIPSGPHIGPQTENLRTGSCREFSDIVIYVFRAVGIPCGEDYITRGDNNANHFWNFVISKNGKVFRMELSDRIYSPAEDFTNPKGKVRRYTYSINRSMLEMMDRPFSRIHPIFRYPKFIDVTCAYSGKWNRALSLSADFLYNKESIAKNEIIYLCVSQWMDWIPIDWTVYKKGHIRFSDVEGDIVCRLAFWDGIKMQFCSDPFLFEKETGKVKLFFPSKECQPVSLYYKYHLYAEPFIHRMVDGVFEGANNINFVAPDTLLQIKKAPYRLYNTVILNSSNKEYKYLRYKGNDNSYCNIAEISFYARPEDSLPIKGKVIGTPGCYYRDGSHEYTNAFDGNPYTSFDYLHPSSGWTGLELLNPSTVRKIIYTPRNRDNFIRKGDIYELLYWKEHHWISTGCKMATSDSLDYKVPKGTLLYLKNHTRGKDERIFEYHNQEQTFW